MSDFDTSVLHAMYALREPTVVYGLMAVTVLGSTMVVGILSVCVGLWLIVREKISHFLGFGIALAGTGVAVFGLKELIGRARPDSMYQVYLETSPAFPSGHAAFSLALYGFLAYLAWKYLPRKYAWTAIIFLSFLIALIGFSRLYLGLHYVSDVLAGFAVGAAFLSLGIVATERLSRSSIWS